MIPRYHIPMHPSMPPRQFWQQPGRPLGQSYDGTEPHHNETGRAGSSQNYWVKAIK